MKFCPHCGGDISAHLAIDSGKPFGTGAIFKSTTPDTPKNEKYDQTKIWHELVELARSRAGHPPSLVELIDPAIESLLKTADPTKNTEGLSTIVHLVFDQRVTPEGGLLLKSMRSDGTSSIRKEQLELMGYLVVNDKVVQADGVPVSRAYGAIDYWGGDKQFKRWHLAKPVTLEPSRNGNPFFMDEEMIAFGAVWRDPSKIKEAMMHLLAGFATGIAETPAIAQPMVLLLTQRE